MKKLIVLAFAAILCVACSTEEEITPNEGSNLEVVLENYKGIFTSTNGQYRGTLDVTLSEDNRSASADLTLSTGEVISIFTDQVSDLGNVRELTFSSNDLSFTMTTGVEEEILEIETVSFRGTESAIIASRNTERAPVTPLSGTFDCPGCPAPLNNSTTQTFNFMFTTANGNSAITTQTTLNTTTYNGIGVQFSCVDGGSGQTSCTINSGDGVTTGVAFNAGGGNVGWTGTHTFDNGPSSGSDCSGVSGNWGWNSPILGNIGGSFTSDNACPPPATTLVFEDFETAIGTAPSSGYVVRSGLMSETAASEFNINNATPGNSADVFGRVSLADLNNASPSVTINNIQGTQFLAVGDTDQTGNPNGSTFDFPSINWFNLNVSSFSTLNVSAFFAENDGTGNQWDPDHSVRIEYSTDNTNWTPIFAIESESNSTTNQLPKVDINLDGLGEGAIITNTLTQYSSNALNVSAINTISIRVLFTNFTFGEENAAIDNVTISAF